MLSKFKITFVITSLLLVFAANAHAATYTAYSKFGRGVVNTLTFPGEIVRQQLIMGQSENPVVAFFGGGLKGLIYMFPRLGGGLYELFTFPIENPAGYKPVLNPPTLFEKANNELRAPWAV